MTTSWGPTEVTLQNRLDLTLTHTENDREEHRHPNYCISWSKHIYMDTISGKKLHLFACCGGSKAEIVAAEKDNTDDVSSWQPWSTFVDDYPDEKFRACTFGGKSIGGSPFLILGGKAAIIKLVDTVQRRLEYTLQGHQGTINDLKVSPRNESLLLSASGDEGIRLWNLDARACVAVFAGIYGHRKAVLSISWDFRGEMFASSGVDGYVRLWNGLNDRHASTVRAMSCETDARGVTPYYDQYPRVASNKLHTCSVDCVHWMRDGRILSKSMDNEFLLWVPDDESRPRPDVASAVNPPTNDVIVFMRFQVSERRNFFSRFGINPLDEQVAVGGLGTISIWNLNEELDNFILDDHDCAYEDDGCLDFRPDPIQTLEIKNPEKIRVVAYAPHGKMLVACSDEGNLYGWEPRNRRTITP